MTIHCPAPVTPIRDPPHHAAGPTPSTADVTDTQSCNLVKCLFKHTSDSLHNQGGKRAEQVHSGEHQSGRCAQPTLQQELTLQAGTLAVTVPGTQGGG